MKFLVYAVIIIIAILAILWFMFGKGALSRWGCLGFVISGACIIALATGIAGLLVLISGGG